MFTALITSVSPLFTSMVGPGNCPFTVMILFVWHRRFTVVSLTCVHHNGGEQIKH
jgi:hypothetical protein